MSWAALVVLIGYVLAGRWLLAATMRGRAAAFALLNLAAVYFFFFRSDEKRYMVLFAGLFVVYVVMVSGQYLALRCWSERLDGRAWLSFAAPLAMLVVIRYLPIGAVAAIFIPAARKVLAHRPDFNFAGLFVGLSYLAFRASHLALEVRNGAVKRPGYWDYLSFTFFAPTFSVGPINPYSRHTRNAAAEIPIGRALLRVLVGAVKFKFLSPLLNQLTYAGLLLDGHPHPWMDFPVAVIAYYFYLYCNFSGYCDIAIGGAGLMGVSVAENFDNPFASRNVKDFWNRWHITLSQWMRDVVFSPLSKTLVRAAGPTRANHAVALTIVVVFLLVGVWHGVGWNYAAFGAAHALGVVTNHYYTIGLKSWLGKDRFAAYNRNRLVRALAVALTFAYVAASFFLFANSMAEMKQIFALGR